MPLNIVNRRSFFRDCALVGTSVGVGSLLPHLFHRQFESSAVADETPHPSFEQRLKELKIELPPPSKPVAIYAPAIVTGNLLFTAGHIPWLPDGKLQQGRVGADLTLEQGADAARLVGLHLLTTLQQTLGSLDRVVRLVKALGIVNCTSDFTQQPKVINGFSELMVQVFGEVAGKGGRSAIGAGSLPSNVPVEIEAIFEVRPT
ncbi:RidA family protein [Schlesneria paludicola]|uniref:RidA family protein n=1 Tax=Schlesneria paludicola TaxID=360056 RepID=UPI00029AC932|nr:RidA family protein [Schlesneria paludicola]